MTTFSYSTGNPSNLVAGGTASMTDISGPFTDLATFINGSIDTTNLATSAKPATILGAYRTIAEAACSTGGSAIASSGSYLLTSSLGVQKSPATVGSADPLVFWLDGADYAVSGLTAKIRVRGTVFTNSVAPAITFTFGLYPVTVAGGVSALTATLGTVTASSTAAIASPSASSVTTAVSSDISFPTAGAYALGFAASAAPGGTSVQAFQARLDLRHV